MRHKIWLIFIVVLITGCASARKELKPSALQATQLKKQTIKCVSCKYMQERRYGDVIKLVSAKRGLPEYKDELNLGTAYLLTGNTKNAVSVFQHILERFPIDVAALNNLSIALYAEGMIEASNNIMRKAVSLADNTYPVIFNKAQINVFNNEYRNAVMALKKIKSAPISNVGRGIIYLRKKNYGNAAAYLKKALTAFPDNASVYRGLGMAYAGMNETASAIRNLKKAVKLDKSLVGTFITLAMLQNNEGYKKEARKSISAGIDRADRIKGKDIYSYVNYMTDFARALYLLNDYGNSLRLINKTLLRTRALNDRDLKTRMYNVAGDDYYALGVPNKAIRAYTYALHYNKNNEQAYKGIAESYLAIKNEVRRIVDLKNAVKNIEKAITINPDDSNAFVSAGDIYYAYSRYLHGEQETEQFNKAILSYMRALTLSPDNYNIQLKLGALYYLADKDKLSIKTLNIAIRNGASRIKAMPLLAGVYYVSGKYAAALDKYNQIIKQFPSYCRAYIAKGLILMRTGGKKESKLTFEQGARCEAQAKGK